MKDHQINLAIATHTSDSFAHIESHFYQSAARELHHGGELYFIAANIFPITSQDAHDHVAVFEALLSCITGSFQLKEAFLEFRAGFGMPLVSFIGYNSTPCMERPERFNQYAENVANPTLSPMILELRNLYLRYGLICSASKTVAAHAARHDDQKKEIEQDYRHKHAAYMMEVARLLKNGEYMLRLVRKQNREPRQAYYSWIATNLTDILLPRKQMENILQSANVSNYSGLPLFVSLQLLVGDPDSASDVFLGTSPKYGEIYGGLKLYLKDLDLFLQFETVFHRRKWQLRLAERLLHCCSNKEAERRITLLREKQKVSSNIVTENSNYRELIEGELPVSVQGKTVVERPKNEMKITFPVSPQTRKYLERDTGKKEFYFVKLVFGSSCPLWDGTGFPEEVSSPLRGVGLSLYSFSSNTWIPISANFRFRYVVSRLTAFASQAAIVARQSITYHSDRNAPNHFSEPESDEEED
ncbi:uncharacterized protein FA14DRAFT_846 [Meira miltonrushii]|uniref:Uncharacterized protein n=1 Tax=Meira miltonrushii TaxID=1280837 RepID=A0A316VJI6_9BASI|nr:uncharacterized protein FA14DRAFT_846 [Meira miltonrushii]PWN36463.1 hypothetical protein FA14DRAFT_846 [Meira miltonrushii]